MLANLALLHRRCGNDADAARVTARALELPPDQSRPGLEAWGALDAALAGDARRAGALLQSLRKARQAAARLQLVARLAEAVVAALRRDFAAARTTRSAAVVLDLSWKSDASLVRAHGRAVAKIAELQGGAAGLAWRAWVWASS
jgi:hypothetical protein